MTAHRLVVLRCNRDGCIHFFTFEEAPDGAAWKPPRITDARRQARGFGWRAGIRPRVDAGPAPTFDFCPEHGADIESPDYTEVHA